MLDKIAMKTQTLEKALDASWLRNSVISQNIANVDTPKYKRKTVAFEELLKNQSDGSFVGTKTDPRHISIGGSDVSEVEVRVTEDNSNSEMRLDGNNVDIDSEMALLAKNSLKYNMLVQRISGQLKSIRSAINEGRK
jgi:flagellar basal-body rod protein FlgB